LSECLKFWGKNSRAPAGTKEKSILGRENLAVFKILKKKGLPLPCTQCSFWGWKMFPILGPKSPDRGTDRGEK